MKSKEVSQQYADRREEKGVKIDGFVRKCHYICDRGIYKGKYLEDVCNFHPDYIDFLIRMHRSTFPAIFCDALRECGVDPDYYRT